MSHEYVISAGGVTVTSASTLVFINPPAAPAINLEMIRAWVGQSANATSAQQRVQLETQVSVFPSALTATAPVKLKQQDAASIILSSSAGGAGTSGTNATAEGAGAKTAMHQDAFNVLNGWLWVPTPVDTIVLPGGLASGFGLFLPVAPATLTNWSFGVIFREV